MSIDVRRYRVYVEPLSVDLGGGFVSYASDLIGCLTDGATPSEALSNVYDAIACWLEAAVERGERIPLPEAARQLA